MMFSCNKQYISICQECLEMTYRLKESTFRHNKIFKNSFQCIVNRFLLFFVFLFDVKINSNVKLAAIENIL